MATRSELTSAVEQVIRQQEEMIKRIDALEEAVQTIGKDEKPGRQRPAPGKYDHVGIIVKV